MINLFKKNQTCSIYKEVTADQDGSQILTDTIITAYTNIPCTYWWARKVRNFNDWASAREIDVDRFDVDIDAVYRDSSNPIIKWYKIKLIWENLWDEWYYLIDNVETFHKVSWQFNNISIRCTRINTP